MDGPEAEFRVLDEETVQDPSVLLDVITDILNAQRVTHRALAMVIVLLLNRMDAFDAPPHELETIIKMLRQYLEAVAQDAVARHAADNLFDLLEAKE